MAVVKDADVQKAMVDVKELFRTSNEAYINGINGVFFKMKTEWASTKAVKFGEALAEAVNEFMRDYHASLVSVVNVIYESAFDMAEVGQDAPNITKPEFGVDAIAQNKATNKFENGSYGMVHEETFPAQLLQDFDRLTKEIDNSSKRLLGIGDEVGEALEDEKKEIDAAIDEAMTTLSNSASKLANTLNEEVGELTKNEGELYKQSVERVKARMRVAEQ